jgi:hypothetical protein
LAQVAVGPAPEAVGLAGVGPEALADHPPEVALADGARGYALNLDHDGALRLALQRPHPLHSR